MNAIAEPPNVNVTPPTSALGDLVRAPRLELGLTQVELADRVGMSQRWISNIERNETDLPRREHLLRLAEALTLDVADLLLPAQGETRFLVFTRALFALPYVSDGAAAFGHGKSMPLHA